MKNFKKYIQIIQEMNQEKQSIDFKEKSINLPKILLEEMENKGIKINNSKKVLTNENNSIIFCKIALTNTSYNDDGYGEDDSAYYFFIYQENNKQQVKSFNITGFDDKEFYKKQLKQLNINDSQIIISQIELLDFIT